METKTSKYIKIPLKEAEMLEVYIAENYYNSDFYSMSEKYDIYCTIGFGMYKLNKSFSILGKTIYHELKDLFVIIINYVRKRKK